MILALDVGNTRLSCGIFFKDQIISTFNYLNTKDLSEEKLIDFFEEEFKKNRIDKKQISKVVVCSVVPFLNQKIKKVCNDLLNKVPYFVSGENNSILKINYENTQKLGSDRIAAAVGAISLGLKENLIVVDMGTATTVDAISKEKEFWGGAILPGIKLMLNALSKNTAQLPEIDINRPAKACCNSTLECINSGIYYCALGAIRELIMRYTNEKFNGKKPIVIATGGMSYLFEDEKIIDKIEKNLVLEGLNKIIKNS